jgi:integrase
MTAMSLPHPPPPAPDVLAASVKDARRRVLDVHALRHTFGAVLSKRGVSARTAQAAMRHSKIDPTMNVYNAPG